MLFYSSSVVYSPSGSRLSHVLVSFASLKTMLGLYMSPAGLGIHAFRYVGANTGAIPHYLPLRFVFTTLRVQDNVHLGDTLAGNIAFCHYNVLNSNILC